MWDCKISDFFESYSPAAWFASSLCSKLHMLINAHHSKGTLLDYMQCSAAAQKNYQPYLQFPSVLLLNLAVVALVSSRVSSSVSVVFILMALLFELSAC